MTQLHRRIKVFTYVLELDCFVITDEFRQITDYVGLTEWHPAVWIGRLFILDNDFGEHWFDNWDARQEMAERAAALGYQQEQLMILDPIRFQDGRNGPCHTAEFRKRFWTDVLMNLAISADLIVEEARAFQRQVSEFTDIYSVPNLEGRIQEVLSGRFPSG